MSVAEGIHTRALGDYIAASRGTRLPHDLIEWMKLLTLDTIGCGLLSSGMEPTQRLLQTLEATKSAGPSLGWGTSSRLSAADAAMVNGTSVQGFEYDDVGPGSHYGSVTSTVALALAEAGARLSGMDLITATVTGIEVAARVAESVGRVPIVDCGFHAPGLFGAFAAAAAAACSLELDPTQSAHALGHAAQFTGGVMGVHHGGMGKRLLAGKAAHSGTLAGQLAGHGFTNVDNIFECGYGSFPSAFTGGRDAYELDKLSAGLGERYRSYEIRFKMWACRAPIHSSLEAIKALRKERPFTADEVAGVDIRMPRGSFTAVGWDYTPTTVTSAQLNLQYCVAIMLLEDDVQAAQFTDDKIGAPAVIDLVGLIRPRHDPSLDYETKTFQTIGPRESVVEITLHSGEKLEHKGPDGLRRFTGDDEETREAVVSKFMKNTDGVLAPPAQKRLVELCFSLEELDDATAVLAPLTA